MKFIHITDTHLVPPGEPLCGLEPSARLTKAIDTVNRIDGDAAFAVVTGDLSYHGMEPAYRTLREILADLAMPHHLLIGNHDDRESFKRIFPETPVDENGFVQYTIETAMGAFVMLDSVVDGQSHGKLCEKRIAWLSAELSRLRGTPVYLFLHHPPFDVGIGSLDACRLEAPEALGQVLKNHGDIRHLFYGHVHRPISGSWRGIPATTLPGTNHQVGLYLGPEPTMLGSHEPPAYGVCLIDDETVAIHMRYFLDESARFDLGSPQSKSATTPGELAPPPASMQDQA